jgi:hypothetical protein
MGKILQGSIDLSCSIRLKKLKDSTFKEGKGYICDQTGS